MKKTITYFVSGHRDITPEEFENHYTPRLKTIIEDDEIEPFFLVGDYQGADIMAQKKLLELGVKPYQITIYFIGNDRPMNVADNQLCRCGGFDNDEDRDAAMTIRSDEDILWIREEKEDSGTARNAERRKEYKIFLEKMSLLDLVDTNIEAYLENKYSYNKNLRGKMDKNLFKDLSFSEILIFLEDGAKAFREGWNGKGMFLYYVPKAEYPAMTDIAKETFGENALVKYEAYVAMKNAQGTVSIWNPSQVDLFAKDWMIL